MNTREAKDKNNFAVGCGWSDLLIQLLLICACCANYLCKLFHGYINFVTSFILSFDFQYGKEITNLKDISNLKGFDHESLQHNRNILVKYVEVLW